MKAAVEDYQRLIARVMAGDWPASKCKELTGLHPYYQVLLEVLLNCVSVCVFIVEDHLFQVFEVCLPFGENAFQAIVLVLNVCFLGPFFLRMVLAPNMRAFLLSKYTVADYHTIPPAILGV
ncbi:calcium-activated potassium channel slo-1-like, partial [Penaeus monodon]|uniref:calcium-activated potassium channel slo-1-like n=1 Tax=Penaeus monodon TaxID=6687 RepID=UPI0018A7D22E